MCSLIGTTRQELSPFHSTLDQSAASLYVPGARLYGGHPPEEAPMAYIVVVLVIVVVWAAVVAFRYDGTGPVSRSSHGGGFDAGGGGDGGGGADGGC